MMSGLLTNLLAAAPVDAGTTRSAAIESEVWSRVIVLGVVDLGIFVLGIAFVLCVWRLVKGPTLADRGIASDLLAMQVVGLAILLTIRLETLVYFDTVLIVAILGFASTTAFAQYIGRRRAV
jgi:multisubunit Na+/H+ antiporter MnhF subunit